MYRCRMCQYHTDKVTVMRHHVMSHLLYHPYRCPYCDAARSVKSSPINKHVRLRHPGQEPNFICERDEDMERCVLRKGKERKSIYIAPFIYYILYLKALRR